MGSIFPTQLFPLFPRFFSFLRGLASVIVFSRFRLNAKNKISYVQHLFIVSLDIRGAIDVSADCTISTAELENFRPIFCLHFFGC